METAKPKTKLEEIAEARAALEAKRVARDAEKAESDAVAAAQLDLANETALFAAEEEHGRLSEGKIGAVDTRLGIVIVKRPHAAVYRKLQDSKGDRPDFEKFVRLCLVHPDKPTFDAWLEEQPGILMAAADVCTGLAGARVKEVSGKS